MTDAPPVFPTFCHISEYGTYGYESLHRLLAVSDRLHLWAPSGVLLRQSRCQVSPEDFIRYVESGRIVVHGRETWLLDPDWREWRAQDWPGATWDPEIDGAIKSIYLDDAMQPPEKKRVRIAPPEQGASWAAGYVDAHPEEIGRWERILNSDDVGDHLPGGTLSYVRLQGRKTDGDMPTMVRAIYRIAYNHGDAFRNTGAEAPILLSRLDRNFLDALGGGPDAGAGVLPATAAAPDPAVIARLTEQMFDVLRTLDVISGRAGAPGGLDGFLRSEGHTLLTTWFAQRCQLAKYFDPGRIDDLIMSEVESDVERGTFQTPLQRLRRSSRTETAIATADLVGDVLDVALSPTGLAKLALSAYPVTKGAVRQMGWAPRHYTGQQWPYLYAFGRRASRKARDHLRYALRDHRERRDH